MFITDNMSQKDDCFEKYIDTDDALFHYTKMCSGLDIISKMELKLSELWKSRDPYESKHLLFSAFALNEGEEGLQNNITETVDKINDIIKHKSKFISFCYNGKDNKGYKKSGMWAQYGEGFKGMIVVLSKSKLENYIKQKHNKCGSFIFRNMDYIDTLFLKREIVTMGRNMINDTTEIYKHLAKYINEIYFSKLNDYKPEGEYRLLLIENENEEIPSINIKDIIMGVLIGGYYLKEYNEKLNALSKEYEFPLLKVYFEKKGENPELIKYDFRVTHSIRNDIPNPKS